MVVPEAGQEGCPSAAVRQRKSLWMVPAVLKKKKKGKNMVFSWLEHRNGACQLACSRRQYRGCPPASRTPICTKLDASPPPAL